MKSYKILLIFCLLSLTQKADAYITYLNGRIDHSLYDAHDTKTIVAGTINQVMKYDPDSTMLDFGGPEFKELQFKINTVIMGDGQLINQTLTIPISSFTWPEALVELKQESFCIFILREYKENVPHFQIEVVIPATSTAPWIAQPLYTSIQNNNLAIKFLETELLAVLKTKLKAPQIREALLLLGPILQKENIGQIETWIEYKNDWVIRAALAAIVYASQSERHLKYLARNINEYFTNHIEKSMLGATDDFNNYASYYVYYTYVFFLDPSQRNFGSTWDEKEAGLNKAVVAKLKATGLLSKSVCVKLDI
jgi:hypothetical protein